MKTTKFLLVFFSLTIHCGRISETGSDNSETLTDGLSSSDHRIFVSSTTHNGNFGGITGMDTHCQNLATAAGLVRTYMAIASNGLGVTAASRLTISGTIYLFTSSSVKVIVATGSADLWDGAISNTISVDENYTTRSPAEVWTGTQDDGSAQTIHCGNWLSAAIASLGEIGNTDQTDGDWVEEAGAVISRCNTGRRVYCISQ